MDVARELSIQLYSLRSFADLEGQLRGLAALGFRRVETIGSHIEDARATRALLDANGITAPTGHVGLAELRRQPDRVLVQAKTIGIEQLFMPAVPQAERYGQPAEFWRGIGLELARLAERFAGEGIGLGYHNHHWELAAYPDGSTPLGHLLDASRGSPLTIEADLAWLVRGGADPLAWLERIGDRLTAVHVKDIAAEGQNADEDGWADIGEGVLDWPKLWRASLDHGARWMVLEHDKPAEPLRFARESRAYLLATVA